MALKINAKFEGKVNCAFKNDMKNLANISMKADNLGSFFQCAVYIFLGHDGCFKN